MQPKQAGSHKRQAHKLARPALLDQANRAATNPLPPACQLNPVQKADMGVKLAALTKRY